jgi:tRNA(fMet)-specific endonuclease VapC
MSLFVLDTDVMMLYQHRHPVVSQHIAAHPPHELAITVITVEEQVTGRYTVLRRPRTRSQLATAYAQLAETVHSLGTVAILPFPEPAILRYEYLKSLKLQVGSKDLCIAAIVLENGAILVTRNTRDFQRVPGLVLEDWTV